MFEYDADLESTENPGVGATVAKVVALDPSSRHQVQAQFLHKDPAQQKDECLPFAKMRRAPNPGYKFWMKVKGKRVKHELVGYAHGGVKIKVWQSAAQRKLQAAGTLRQL